MAITVLAVLGAAVVISSLVLPVIAPVVAAII
jgi:hypothetical protein